MDYDLIWRKDARHAVLHNEGQAAVAAIEEISAVEMRPRLMDYDLEHLMTFAELCKMQGVTDKDLKNVASDVTWAAKAVFEENERAFRQAIMEQTENGVVARFTVTLPPPINPERFELKWDGVKQVKMPPMKKPIPVWVKDYKEDALPTFKNGYICPVCKTRQTYGRPDYCPYCGNRIFKVEDVVNDM